MINKQTAHLDRETVKRKIDEGAPITKAELSVFLGVGYATVRSWPWLPMLGGLMFYEDFITARRLHLGLEKSGSLSPCYKGHFTTPERK